MAKAGDYTVSDIYQGGYSSFKSGYGDIFTGYRVSAGSLSSSMDARTANVLKDASDKIISGIKSIEISMLSPEVAEAIPKQHLKEINRLSKLTGVDITVHAPVIEPSGISKEGFSESNREAVERQLNLSVERSHEMSPDGSFVVNFHSSALLPGPEITKTKEGEIIEKMLVINQETGQISAVKREEKHYPGEKGGVKDVHEELKILNNSEWVNGITNLLFYKKEADELISRALIPLAPILKDIQEGEKPSLTPEQNNAFSQIGKANTYLGNVEASFNSAYNKAYKYSDEQGKKILKEISKEWVDGTKKIKEESNMITHPLIKSQMLEKAIEMLSKIETPPEVSKSLDDFSRDKTAQTFANVAFNSYKKFKNNAPIISIENPPAGAAFSRGEDLKKIAEEARKKFVEKAVTEGMSKSEAKEQAEKLIGVTWDLGHINMLRKYGFETKDIIKETGKIAPLLKHIHLSDNFGFEHTELPMGMGNVPFKKIMDKLGDKGFEAKKVIEAMSWWQHFSPGGPQNAPLLPSLQAMGSPIYAMNMAPYWNQSAGFQQDYYPGMGEIFPQVHFETFGAGFSQLPMELGGQKAGGAGSRTSGRPME
ncbi:MAG: hypothetical protein KKA64_01250 [Nanoarchaeota archaeon]|nr:hypothetical protein [Nanoarchaeota archaeon]